MKEIKITIKDNMDIALLLSGINYLRHHNIARTKTFLELPKEFSKDSVMKEQIDDYDRLNSIGVQLSNMLMATADNSAKMP